MMDNVWFVVDVVIGISILIGAASLLSHGYSDKREACIKAGYKWSPTKYVCVVNP